MGKKWLLIVIIAVVLIIIAVPLGMIICMHYSTYDCSFEYIKSDNILNDIARKHTYYQASDKTLEIELNQDIINSLINDEFGKLDLQLPEKFSVQEIMFNTRNQRLYINARYGIINVPVSAKINVNISDSGVDITGDDLMIGNMKAPGFIKKQITQDSLAYSVKYDDLGLPRVFTVKDVKFGSGMVKASIQLDSAKIAEMALGYRSDLIEEIDKFKSSQSEMVMNLVDKVLGTGVLSEEKVKEYVDQALNNEELINSAIFFATADDLNKYLDKMQEAQQKVADWAAPLKVINYYGSIDETVDKVLYDEELRDLLAWFLPLETINKYVGTVEGYYGMYEDLLSSMDKFAANIDTTAINKHTKTVLDFLAQAEDARQLLLAILEQLDFGSMEELVAFIENDQDIAKKYLADIDPNYYNFAKESLLGLNDTKVFVADYIRKADLSAVDELANVVDGRRKYAIDIVDLLKSRRYEDVAGKLINEGVIDKKTSTFVNKYVKQINLDIITEFLAQ